MTRFPFVGSDKLIYAMDGVSKYMLHFIMGIQGQLHPDHLAKAIDYGLANSPILKSIARLRRLAPYWEVVQDLAPFSLLTVKDLSGEIDAEGAARDVLDGYINDYIDVTQVPPARFLLIQLSPDRSMFVVKVHHCALDPAALFHLVRDIQNAYGRLLQGEPLPPLSQLGDRSRKRLLRHVSPTLWGRVIFRALWKKVRTPGSKPRCFVQFSDPKPGDTIAYRSLRFEGGNYAVLRARCKSMAITANELVMAALCRTIRQWNGQPETGNGVYSIVMPVDLRRYVRRGGKAPKIMASFIGGSWVTVPVAAVTSLDATVEVVTRETRYIKDHHLGLLASLGFPLLYFIPPRWLRHTLQRAYRRHPSKSVPTSVFAYLGKIDRALSTFPGCRITSVEGVGTGFYPVGLDVVVLAYGHAYTVTVSYLKYVCSEAEMDQFMSLLAHEILQTA